MKNQRFINSFAVLLSSIILILFGFIFLQFAINVPKWDDFAFIKFVADFNETDRLVAKFDYLFKQHNEHRVVTTRLVALLDFYLFGKLNFEHLMLVGNLGLLLIIYLFYKQARKIEVLFPLCVVWLNTSFYENSFWGMASFQNFWVVFFITWGIYLVVHGKLTHMLYGLIIPVLAIFTSGNGLVILPLIGIYYLIQKERSRLIQWVLYSLILLSIYFISYQKPPDAISEGFYLEPFIQGVLFFLGSAFEGAFWGTYMYQVITCLGFLLGFGSIFISLIFLVKGPKKPYQWFFILISGFVVATALIVAFNRVGQLHAHSLLVSRYKIYSVVLISNFLLLCYQIFTPSRLFSYFRIIVFFGSLVYYICIQHYYLAAVVAQKQYLQSFLFNWTQQKLSSVFVNYYEAPTNELLFVSQRPTIPAKGTHELKHTILKSEINLLNAGLNANKKPFLLIQNELQSYVVPFSLNPKTGFRSLINYNTYFQTKAQLHVDLNNLGLPGGKYTISYFQPGERLNTIGTVNLISLSQEPVKQNW